MAGKKKNRKEKRTRKMATRSEALTAICCLTAALHFYRFLAGQRKGREREREREEQREAAA